MTADRAEWTGVGAAILLHALLILALSTTLAGVTRQPEPPSMEVELVDEVALDNAAPQSVPTPSAPPPAPSDYVPAPTPAEVPPPPPAAVPLPTARPVARPQPQRQQQRTPPRPAQRPGLGDDFLAKFDDDLAPRAAPARPAAATYSPKARTSVANSIASQAQRCADREPYLGEGADQVRMQVRLSFARSGRLLRPPQIVSASGPADARSKYGDLLEDQVRRIFADCSPFRLPADLYDTDSGGWKETTITYRVRT